MLCPRASRRAAPAPGAQHAVADLGHFEARVDLDADAPEFANSFKLRDEVAQVVTFHEQLSGRQRSGGRVAMATIELRPA
jgi:hypothetical protein